MYKEIACDEDQDDCAAAVEEVMAEERKVPWYAQ